MIELQILSKILKDKSTSMLTLNGIDKEYFLTYPEEYSFISQHVDSFGSVPDKETFFAKFPQFPLIEVTEPEQYLVDTFREEHLYSMTVPVITKLAELVQSDSRAAVDYLQYQLPFLSQEVVIPGTDIIQKATLRLLEWERRKETPQSFSIPTGFKELDEILGGWQMGEELGVIFARTGQGKSWILIKCLECAWKHRKIPGLIEPEMSAIKTGYRFDTLNKNFSNTALLRGEEIEDYSSYVEKLSKSRVPFFVASPREFSRKITVSKLRSFVQSNKISMLGIDGISYLTDERKQRGDSRTVSLTNISEDLMDLSIELKIPILVVCQSNREGAKDDDAPDLENIRDSDGIAYNASTVIAARQKGPGIELRVRKNRNGRSGDKLTYLWDIDKGVFEYVPDEEDSIDNSEQIKKVKSEYGSGEEVF